jgi:hypothetical protein
VKVILATASGIYDSLAFTHEAGHGSRTYLEWEATAFDGVTMSGIRVLTKNVDGKIARAAIHHRRQGALHKFSRAAPPTRRHGRFELLPRRLTGSPTGMR